MDETGIRTGVCEAITVAQGAERLRATTHNTWQAAATRQQTSGAGATANKIKTLVWAPALARELKEMLQAWAKQASGLGTDVEVAIVLNGPGSEQAASELRQETPPSVQIYALPGPASIGRAQQFVTHRFLRSEAQVLARIDPDGQFPLSSLAELCRRLVPGGPDVVIAQRDEASVAGRLHFLGNVILRLVAMRMGLVADPNSGCYAMNRKAAAALCQVPLPKYPEPRMLAWLKGMSLQVSSVVVPTLPRQSGTSSIKGIGHAVSVFLSSLLELLSCERN